MIVLAVLTVLSTYPTARSPNTLVGRSHVRWRRVAVRGPSMSPALHDGDVVLVRVGASVTRPTAGWAAGAWEGMRVSLRAGSCVASAWTASVGYISMNVSTTRGSSALPRSWSSSPIAASNCIAL